jgi:very-short-patch-repair endonuclease
MKYINVTNKKKYLPVKNTKGKKYITNNTIKPSEAEKLIIKVLKDLKIKFEREVSFVDFKNQNDNFYRFDFLIPEKNIIIEYDGELYHEDGNLSDLAKSEYCRKNLINLVRLNKIHYFKIKETLEEILK